MKRRPGLDWSRPERGRIPLELPWERAIIDLESPASPAPKEIAMAQMKDGCVKPARGPIAPAATAGGPGAPAAVPALEGPKMLARVGKEAPDFEVSAFVRGEGFKHVRLSD